jgi:protein SCO1/2
MRLLLLGLMLLTAPLAYAANSPFDWRQHPGAPLPLDVQVRNEAGQTISLRSLFHGVPVILDLGYFTCPSLCGIVRSSLFDSLGTSGLRPGRDFELVSLSIDAQETPDDAKGAKSRDLAAWKETSDFHYLTASQATIDAVTSAVGFHADFDQRYRQFIHPTGVVVLTGKGTVSSYLLGIGYPAGDLRAALIRARSGGIARAALPILLLCFHYDAATGRYTLVIMKLLRLMGVLTILTLIGLFVVLNRYRRGSPG